MTRLSSSDISVWKRKVKNYSQVQLQSDNTTNIYRLTKEEYKIQNDSITATYKKANNNIKKEISVAGKQVLSSKRMGRMRTDGGKQLLHITERSQRKFPK